jgi:hypothetical protein
VSKFSETPTPTLTLAPADAVQKSRAIPAPRSQTVRFNRVFMFLLIVS